MSPGHAWRGEPHASHGLHLLPLLPGHGGKGVGEGVGGGVSSGDRLGGRGMVGLLLSEVGRGRGV